MDQTSLFTPPKGFLSNTRPDRFADIIGQEIVINRIRPLVKNLSAHFIFFGPPGCGKTTICRSIEKEFNGTIAYYNPTHQTLSELKKICAQNLGTPFLLSVDEIHRMDKKQQEFLLPFLEDGAFKLIASTTENPFTFFTRAIMSRLTSYKLEALNATHIEKILLTQKQSTPELAKKIADLELSDARKAFLIFEQVKDLDLDQVDLELKNLFPNTVYDKTRHYDLLSALIKSMRASEIEEANKWLAHLLVEGGDLMVICRRLMIFASEDIGDAAPYALMKAVACTQAVEKIGMPEAQIILGDCVSFLAKSPKSRENYERIKFHMKNAQEQSSRVPEHRRNRKI